MYKPIHRVTLTNDVNRWLTNSMAQVGKEVRSHSFRISFATDLLTTVPIDKVRALVGHREIRTTLEYDRNVIPTDERDKILKGLDQVRLRKKEAAPIDAPNPI